MKKKDIQELEKSGVRIAVAQRVDGRGRAEDVLPAKIIEWGVSRRVSSPHTFSTSQSNDGIRVRFTDDVTDDALKKAGRSKYNPDAAPGAHAERFIAVRTVVTTSRNIIGDYDEWKVKDEAQKAAADEWKRLRDERIGRAKASCQALRDLLGHGQVSEDRYGNVQLLLTAEEAEAAVEALGIDHGDDDDEDEG